MTLLGIENEERRWWLCVRFFRGRMDELVDEALRWMVDMLSIDWDSGRTAKVRRYECQRRRTKG